MSEFASAGTGRQQCAAVKSRSGRRRGSQCGFTLIEVLVAVLVFYFGLLGLVALQARATQFSVGAEDSNRAALLANEIISTMWTSGTVTLTAAAITAWNARVADTAGSGLPNAAGTVDVVAGVATVTIEWRPVGAAATVRHTYRTQAVLP